MNRPSLAPGRWGPDHLPAAVSITFDNLGEAYDLEMGTWPEDRPLGHHFSVTRVLPTMLQMLAELSFSATFFVEGLNAEIYPQALQGIVTAGHEIGYHAWRHEVWQHLNATEEAHNLERGIQALNKLAISPVGFRPPRGVLTASSIQLLKSKGFFYSSPLGSDAHITDGLAILPFEWQNVDAYAYLPEFASIRESLGDTPAPLSPTQFRANVRSALRKVAQNRSYLSLLFHPFVEEEQEYYDIMYIILAELRTLVSDGLVWSAPCRDVAQWMLNHPAQ
ncbi:MAG TPA: polysaccharide deacetylase family protein [Ktedonobacteraceae bacterium]